MINEHSKVEMQIVLCLDIVMPKFLLNFTFLLFIWVNTVSGTLLVTWGGISLIVHADVLIHVI